MWFVLIGDIISVLLFTLVGFASHGTLGSEGVAMRFGAVFLPWSISYLLIGRRFGVYDPANVAEWNVILQALFAMLLASPLAAVLRGFWLGRDVSPTFVLIMAGVAGITIVAWRGLYVFVVTRRGGG
jgi:hypothetical protein